MTKPIPRPSLWFAPWTWNRWWTKALLVIVILSGVYLGIAMVRRGPTDGMRDARAMRRAILEHVPVGSEMQNARAFMLRERFRFEGDYTNHPFSMKLEDSGGDSRDRHDLDFAYFGRNDSAGILEVRIWGVALVMADGKVTDVLVRTSVYGP